MKIRHISFKGANGLRLSAIAFLFTFMSCGSDPDQPVRKEESPNNPPQETQNEPPENENNEVINEKQPDDGSSPDNGDIVNNSNGDTVRVLLEAGDNMQFNKKEINILHGQTIELTLTHTGKLSKAAMGHNFVLLSPGTDLPSFGQKAAQARDNLYIPKSEIDKIIAHTNLIGGGESTKVTFKVNQKGTYDYVCSFPGHYALMNGKLFVK